MHAALEEMNVIHKGATRCTTKLKEEYSQLHNIEKYDARQRDRARKYLNNASTYSRNRRMADR
jgi:hypothetical protein